MAVLETRNCTKCGEVKSVNQFRKSATASRWCKPCTNIYQRQWRAKNPGKSSQYWRKWYAGVEDADYRRAVSSTPCCPICDQKFVATPHADHDHVTGKFRGVLCQRCNQGLGSFADDIDRLMRAIGYLEVHRGGS